MGGRSGKTSIHGTCSRTVRIVKLYPGQNSRGFDEFDAVSSHFGSLSGRLQFGRSRSSGLPSAGPTFRSTDSYQASRDATNRQWPL